MVLRNSGKGNPHELVRHSQDAHRFVHASRHRLQWKRRSRQWHMERAQWLHLDSAGARRWLGHHEQHARFRRRRLAVDLLAHDGPVVHGPQRHARRAGHVHGQWERRLARVHWVPDPIGVDGRRTSTRAAISASRSTVSAGAAVCFQAQQTDSYQISSNTLTLAITSTRSWAVPWVRPRSRSRSRRSRALDEHVEAPLHQDHGTRLGRDRLRLLAVAGGRVR